jgi:hypothetical protein
MAAASSAVTASALDCCGGNGLTIAPHVILIWREDLAQLEAALKDALFTFFLDLGKLGYRRRQSCGPHPPFVWHCNPTATINYKPREAY